MMTTPTPTPIAIGSQLRFGELVAELAELFNPSAAATAAPLQSLAPTAGPILLLCRLFNSAAVRPPGAVNVYNLVFVATASNASWSPIMLSVRVRSAQFSGLNLEKLSTYATHS